MANTLAVSRADLHRVGMAEARKRVARATRRTLNRSAILCPVDTGYLRATGQMKLGQRAGLVTGQVEYTAEYAAAVHNGRRALTIRAKPGGPLLRFRGDGGRWVYARVVHQRARAARPFLTTALREVSAQEGFRYRGRTGRH
jgi:hypothetical protein